jgi:hypothetical protein
VEGMLLPSFWSKSAMHTKGKKGSVYTTLVFYNFCNNCNFEKNKKIKSAEGWVL